MDGSHIDPSSTAMRGSSQLTITLPVYIKGWPRIHPRPGSSRIRRLRDQAMNRRTDRVASGNSGGLGVRVSRSMVTDSHLVDADIRQLGTSFAGPLLRPFDERYEQVRTI